VILYDATNAGCGDEPQESMLPPEWRLKRIYGRPAVDPRDDGWRERIDELLPRAPGLPLVLDIEPGGRGTEPVAAWVKMLRYARKHGRRRPIALWGAIPPSLGIDWTWGGAHAAAWEAEAELSLPAARLLEAIIVPSYVVNPGTAEAAIREWTHTTEWYRQRLPRKPIWWWPWWRLNTARQDLVPPDDWRSVLTAARDNADAIVLWDNPGAQPPAEPLAIVDEMRRN
jgi:hypothetical protein